MSSGKHQQNLLVGIKVGGRIMIKVTWREKLELILILYLMDWGGAKVVWQWVILNSLCGEANSIGGCSFR